MGKAQSKIVKESNREIGRKRRNAKSRSSKPLGWLARRLTRIANLFAREEDNPVSENHSDEKESSVNKDLDQHSTINERQLKEYVIDEQAELEREELLLAGLDDDNISTIKRLGLSTLYFLESDQNPGCSHWDEEMFQVRYAGNKIRQSKLKNANLGKRPTHSKLEASIAIKETILDQSKEENLQIEDTCSGLNGSQEIAHANEQIDLNRENELIDGLFSHLCYFSPKVTMQSQLTLAQTDDLLELPMIEVVTDEKDQYIIASILINFTLVKQYAVECLTQMNSVRMCELLQQQCNLWHKDRYLVWSDFFIKVSKDSYHRFVTTQFLLEKKVAGAQCSFADAKREGWC